LTKAVTRSKSWVPTTAVLTMFRFSLVEIG
jgi:hypothetical protein